MRGGRMHALVSLLPAPFNAKVEGIWQELEQELGLAGIKATPFPHFSWQIAEAYERESAGKILEGIAAATRPLTIWTSGLGLFTGTNPVIYVPIVKTVELVRFHAQAWEALAPVCHGRSPHYDPGQWLPHISIAYGDVTGENIGPAMQKLAFRNYDWEMVVDNISLIDDPCGEMDSLRYAFAFTAGQSPDTSRE
jgi:2'-5' RNA ligase